MATVSFYFDEMMPRAPVKPLSELGYIVVMANDVGMTEKDDSQHLIYATEQNLVVVTFDRAFAGRTTNLTNHSGLICLSGTQQEIGYIVRTLKEFAATHKPDEVTGQVFWL
jgi:predicted nuclease of predicted toxin-antitoxin system